MLLPHSFWTIRRPLNCPIGTWNMPTEMLRFDKFLDVFEISPKNNFSSVSSNSEKKQNIEVVKKPKEINLNNDFNY